MRGKAERQEEKEEEGEGRMEGMHGCREGGTVGAPTLFGARSIVLGFHISSVRAVWRGPSSASTTSDSMDRTSSLTSSSTSSGSVPTAGPASFNPTAAITLTRMTHNVRRSSLIEVVATIKPRASRGANQLHQLAICVV